ncbi:LysR family transcriptional regulator [Paralcaligenes sp. KSB-10]|uniref:LysR family transcriptional regulator n=1 Tax=Paralcaligenes sp. KSB-10 TaxID=2901142 RepID=UPI001E332A53|nr:LysR family transcriptional regulator [Paralcaligenes sp. KSB-10]UHL65658.1 LysR family transcriptional regulator [Paralcaligenes sp. KSB-10]
MITIKQLEAFYWTAKLGTMDKAAQKLNITQSATTKRLQELERLSSAPLFHTRNKKSELSDLGREVLQSTEKLLIALMGLTEQSSQTIKKIAVGITELSALTWFPEFIKELKDSYPNLLVSTCVSHAPILQSQLLEGKLDFIVIPEHFLTPAMVRTFLKRSEFAWFCSPSMLLPSRELSLDEIFRLPLIRQHDDSITSALCDNFFAVSSIRPPSISESNSLVSLCSLVQAGLGVSYLPKELFLAQLNQNKIKMFGTSMPVEHINYYGAHLKHESLVALPIAEIARQTCIKYSAS